MSLPSFLKGPIVTAIDSIIKAFWSGMESQEASLFSLSRVSSTTQTGVEVFYKELPFVSEIKSEFKRDYIINFSNHVELAGTKEGIDLIKKLFSLESFYFTQMYDVYPTHYPRHLIRFYLDDLLLDDESKLAQVTSFLKKNVPASSSRHLHFVRGQNQKTGLGSSLGSGLWGVKYLVDEDGVEVLTGEGERILIHEELLQVKALSLNNDYLVTEHNEFLLIEGGVFLLL